MIEKNKSWFRRHWILTSFSALIILFILIIILGAFISNNSSSNNILNNISNPNNQQANESSWIKFEEINETSPIYQKEIWQIEHKYNIELEYKTLPALSYSIYSANVTVLSEEDNDALAKYVDIFYVEFNRYPQDFIKNVGLKRIAFVKNLSVIGQDRAAMPVPEIETVFYDIYLGDDSKGYQREVIHHEFYHLIEGNINGDMYYKDPLWAALNDPNFKYGSGGSSAYENPDQYYASTIPKDGGFISAYSTYGLEEDKAEIFANLMVPELYREMNSKTASDLILAKKVNYMKEFFSKHSEHMNEDFWQKILLGVSIVFIQWQ